MAHASQFQITNLHTMKKFLFALPVLFLSVFATYCSKEKLTTPAPVRQAEEVAVVERGGPCTITITASDNITICGLANNTKPCKSCAGASLVGADAGPGTFVYTLTPPPLGAPFYITNTSLTQNATVTIQTSSVPPTTWTIPPGTCVSYSLATTCGLLADRAHD